MSYHRASFFWGGFMARRLCDWIAVIVIALLISSSLLAVEGGKNVAAPSAKEGEIIKSRMKALIAEAANSGDLWTAIMAESYATIKLGARPSGLLAGCAIFGDPLFSFPNAISSYHQRGDALVVVSGSRIYRVAMDGRPLGMAIPLKFSPNQSALSRDGRFLGAVERQNWPEPQLKMSVITLPEGKEVFSTTVTVAKSDYLAGSLQIAEDGTSMAVSVANDDGDVCLFGVRSIGKQVTLNKYFRPVCIGAGGAWAVAEPVSNRKADMRVWTLLVANDVTTLLACTAGPGCAAVITKADPTLIQIVQGNGSMITLPLDVPLERQSRMATVGDFLVISTGWPSKSTQTLDLLGNPIDVPATPTTLLYRWSDIMKSTAMAKPAFSQPGCFCVGRLTGTSVFVGAGTQLAVIDVTQPTLTATALMTLPGDIESLEGEAGRLNVWLNHEQRVIASEDGKILFHGKVNSAHLHDPWFLEVRAEGRAVDWVRLAENPEDRHVVRLKLENPGGYWLRMDRYHRHLVATSDKKDWYDFDPLTGRLMVDSQHGKPPDVVNLDDDVAGTMVSQAGRMVPRLLPPLLPPGDELTVRWNPSDAWRVGKSLVALDRHGQVYIAPPKRGPYQLIGSVNFARGLAQWNDSDVVMVDGEEKIIASLAPGPSLVAAGPAIGKTADFFEEGPWRVKNLFYSPPHGKPLMWDTDRCGFTPYRLRSPSLGGMLIITASLVFEVDSDFGAKIGILDRKGLRDIKN
jgi:hypothetical protein